MHLINNLINNTNFFNIFLLINKSTLKKGLYYFARENNWKLYFYTLQEKLNLYAEEIAEGDSCPPYQIDGYKVLIDQCGITEKNFEDEEFKFKFKTEEEKNKILGNNLKFPF